MMFGLLFVLFSFQSFATHLQKLNIPLKIYESIKQTHKLDETEVSPQMTDILIELKTSHGEFKLPVGYTLETLDLSQYISKTEKFFDLQMSTPYDNKEGSTTIYFVSRYKQYFSKTGKVFGYPCGSVYKLSSSTSKLLNSSPMQIAVNEQQYMSSLGGDYLILHKESTNKMRISYFKLRDTRWTHELCRLD